jgi:large subunit ribosomal protein L10
VNPGQEFWYEFTILVVEIFLNCNSGKSRRFIVALNLDDKKAIVAEVNETAAQAMSLVIADARGVDVTDMTALRAKARAENVQLRVVRNTLAKRAFADTDYACVDDVLVGPSLFAFSMEDPGAAARLFKDFAKDNEEFEVKALSVGGQLLASEQLDVLATLPTLEQALGMLAGVTLAPVTKLARTLNEIPTKAARVVSAVRDAKQEAA